MKWLNKNMWIRMRNDLGIYQYVIQPFIFSTSKVYTPIFIVTAPIYKLMKSEWVIFLETLLAFAFVVLFIFAVLIGVRWKLKVILICSSLTTWDGTMNNFWYISWPHFVFWNFQCISQTDLSNGWFFSFSLLSSLLF